MPANIQAIFEGKEATKFLNKLKKKAGSLKDGSKILGGIISATVFQDIISHFEQEEGSDGAWTSWSESYAISMSKRGRGGNKILQDSGKLRQGIQPGNYRAQMGGILFFNPSKVSGGFPYAAAHDIGGPKLPRRNFMWLSEDGMDKIATLTLKWITSEND